MVTSLHVMESLFHNPGNLLPVESGMLAFILNSEYRSRNPESHSDWNPDSKLHRQRSGIQYLESRFHGVKSRTQDCFGSPLMA